MHNHYSEVFIFNIEIIIRGHSTRIPGSSQLRTTPDPDRSHMGTPSHTLMIDL